MTSTSKAETMLLQNFPVLNARLDLPEDLAWFNELSASDRVEFFSGLLSVLASDRVVSGATTRHRGDDLLAALSEYLRGWQATVEICSSPELMASYKRAEDDLRCHRLLTYEEVFGGV